MTRHAIGGVPLRWHAAGIANRLLPQVRGRTRIVDALAGPRVALPGRRILPVGHGLRLDVDMAEARHVWMLRWQRPALAPVLEGLLGPGSVMADVGANVGLYTCWAARLVGPSGRVVAFEPVPGTHAQLVDNVTLNQLDSLVRIQAVAVGAEAGTVTVHAVPGASGLSSAAAELAGSVPHVVRLTSLDVEFGDDRLDLVKIDVEGYEESVIRGMTGLLGRERPPVLIVEIVDEHLRRAGSSAGSVSRLLTDRGFSLFSLAPAGLRPWQTGGTANVLAVPAARLDATRSSLAGARFARDQST